MSDQPTIAELAHRDAQAARLWQEKLAALAEFAAGAGHEINNPLAVISGRAQLLLRDETDPERRRDLALIRAQAQRVHEMIADLMLFARPPQPRPVECDAPSLVRQAVQSLAELAAERNAVVTVSVVGDVPRLTADPTQFVVAVRAVVQNAVEAVPADRGTVEIQVSAAGDDKLAIAVRDNGPGLSAEAQRHAFDPFYSGRAAGRGLGLGLSKCWRIVTLHGGQAVLDSPATGGTTVTLVWPTNWSITTAQQNTGAND